MSDNMTPYEGELATKNINEFNLSEVTTNLHKYNLFSILSYLEANQDPSVPLIGEALSPTEELFRLQQNPSMSFCFRNIDAVSFAEDKYQIAVNEIGLLGPNSPLPSHLIEFIFQRKHQYGDGAWAGFVNMLQHRILTMFYRSWMNAQSVLSLESERGDKFSRYLASIAGIAVLDKNQNNSYVDYYSKIYFAGYCLPRNRSMDNFQNLLSQYFLTAIRIEENVGQWVELPKQEQTCLGQQRQYSLGDGLIIGNKIYDLQTKFRIKIGPLKLDEYVSFFRGEYNAFRLMEWVRYYVGEEYEWDVQLVLAQEEVPRFMLGSNNRLGLTTWLGEVHGDRDNIILSY